MEPAEGPAAPHRDLLGAAPTTPGPGGSPGTPLGEPVVPADPSAQVMEPQAPELVERQDGLFPAQPGSLPSPGGSEPALEGWRFPEDGGSETEELLGQTVNPNVVCGLGGHFASLGGHSPQDTSLEPRQPDEPPATALYEVVCDLSTPLHGSIVSIQLDDWLCPTLLPSSCIINELPAPLPATLQAPSPTQLHLTEEEKRLLAQEGVTLPGTLPLTQAEERILKKVRRKIRNKQSAQDSRRRKKEYLDGLESRAAACSAQNQELRKKIQELEKRNGSLLRQLQALLTQTSNKAAQTSTCVLILLLSLGLLLFPSYSPFRQGPGGDWGSHRPTGVISRNILTQGELLGSAGGAPFPALGWLWVEAPGPADGAEGGDGSPPSGTEPSTNSSAQAPPGDVGALVGTAKQGHGDEM
ncbi:cyclic AMP-responsive element-binding protein 3-like protein 4 [Rhynochetos jubatus]